MDPRPWTFRELFIMAEGKRAEEWVWWSEILALTANCHRNPNKSRPFSAAGINPYRAGKSQGKQGRISVGDFIGAMRAKYDDFKGEGVESNGEFRRNSGRQNSRRSRRG